MRHPNLASPHGGGLLIIDLQERLLPKIHNRVQITGNIRKLIRFAQVVRLPVFLTEQYPKGLGRTVAEVREELPTYEPIEKVTFSAFGEAVFEEKLRAAELSTLLVAGIEAHICVNQTTLDALARGYSVHVLADATGSRHEANWRIGLEKMRQAGAIISSFETATYEILVQADTPTFREVLPLFKEPSAGG